MHKISGVFSAVLTPLNEDYSIDLKLYLFHCQWLLKQKLNGLGIFGTGIGGTYTLKQLLSADLFGLKSLGKITGLINLTDTIGSGPGPVMTALFLDLTGNYQTSFSIITCITCLGLIFASFLQIDDKEIERSKTKNE